MGRNRIYTDAAERQKAYRERLQQRGYEQKPVVAVRPIRKKSRPARLTLLIDAAQCLHDEYEDWLNGRPDALESSVQYQKAEDTVEKLAAVLELLGEIDPPRGYGRD